MKAMVSTFILITSLFLGRSYAQTKIEVAPRSPIINEVFQIIFKLNVEGSVEPEINFSSKGLEILGKKSQGLSTRTIYQNGKITVTREMIISYDAIGKSPGIAKLDSIRVKVGGKQFDLPDFQISLSQAPAEPKFVFIAAEVSKNKLYVNEGVTVRYFLYRKVDLRAYDIKKYPKLDGFMKRYLQEPENSQRVSVEGDVYIRSPIYAARLYPEKSGRIKIDSMEVSVSYTMDNLGAFGFSFGNLGRDVKVKTLSSDPIELEVRELPQAGRPANFSGLVGAHKIDLSVPRKNLFINEPMDLRLTISGTGKLEALQPLQLWESDAIQQFDVKSDTALVGSEAAIKSFEYTFLGKAPGVVLAKKLSFSYFDPESEKYKELILDLPEIKIAGSQLPVQLPDSSQSGLQDKSEQIDFAGQDLTEHIQIVDVPRSLSVSYLIYFVLSILVFFVLYTTRGLFGIRDIDWSFFRRTRTKYSYSSFLSLISGLGASAMRTPREVISNSGLDDITKKYFLEVCANFNEKFIRGDSSELNLDSKMLKKLKTYLENQK